MIFSKTRRGTLLCNNYISEEILLIFFILLARAFSDHPCLRQCEDDVNMICEYKFNVEWYYTLSKACYNCPVNQTDCFRRDCISANGVKRPIMVINRSLPGPHIHVCENDIIVVNVTNQLMSSDAITIHWHGLPMVGLPYMDGVSMISQCPITAESTFQYKFKAKPSGTYFWHAHSGLQRADGVFGNLIIRKPIHKDLHSTLYDFDLVEHEIMVCDWTNDISIVRFAAHHHSNGSNKPETILINGRGMDKAYIDPDTNESIYTPLAIFNVDQNKRYRFRLISSGVLNCPIQFSIDDHMLNVIATDGHPIKAREVDSIIIYAGERFDFVLNANNTIKSYWIKARGLMDCDERFTHAKQVAILRYSNASETLPDGETDYFSTVRNGTVLNPLNMKSSPTHITMTQIESLVPFQLPDAEVDFKYYLDFDFNKIDNLKFHHPQYYPIRSIKKNQHLYSPQINNISFSMPSSPVFSQHEDIDPALFCNSSTVSNCAKDLCQCIHTLSIPLNSYVELILIDIGVTFDANHPFHLHGSSFRVVAVDKLGPSITLEEVMQLDDSGQIERKFDNPVLKDTVTVPDGGYVILRFLANNAGYWLLHCHIEWHMEIGMGLLLKVGNDSEFPEIPPGFPTCGSWTVSQKRVKSKQKKSSDLCK